MNIIRNAKNLRNTNGKMRKLSVVPDLDEGERKLNKELYEELMAKREQGEKGWYL